MTVEVVDIKKIFNEFSGGLQDMRAMRDYFKFLYDRSPGEPVLRYALLFGDTHFDYRNLKGDNGLTNWIPSYQTEDSFHPEYSYTSDDYFALLDDDEGLWPYPGRTATRPSNGIEERMDIGIGRLPVQTSQEAEHMVDKIIRYESVEAFGSWRTRYTFLADDHLHGTAGSTQEQDIHTQNSDVVADLVEQTFPQVNIQKIYGQSYQREYIGGSWRLPAVNRDLVSTLNDGTLVLNFSGHGNEDFLMQENVFGRSDLARLTNADSPSVFITATCDFGRYDMPERQSTAEELLLMAEGGSIALFTTVRVVWTIGGGLETLNVGLNRALNREIFKPDESGRPRRLGDILYHTKNTRAGLQGNSHKFNLLGDPTMRIGLPTRDVAIESVNEVALMDSTAALSALDRITVRGSVRTGQDAVDASYNGMVDLTVFDAARKVPVEPSQYLAQPYYTVREDLIWRGTAHVTGGEFEAEFVVPRDISYRNEPGRISAYAYNSDEHAVGYTQRVIVGGTAANPTDDSEGPKIDIFLNDTTFVDGGVVPPNPRLIVRLSDESGINTVGSGVGHELMLIFNDNEQDVVDLSSYYESEAGAYQRGSIEYPVDRDLEPGLNSIAVRAWDVVNNSTTERVEFYVGETGDLALQNVFNYPNPTSGRTRFVFEHNQPSGTPATVQVRVYTINGRPVRTIDGPEALPSGVLSTGVIQIPWDGLDEDQGRLATGVYLYRLRVEVEQPDGARQVSEHIDRIAIIR